MTTLGIPLRWLTDGCRASGHVAREVSNGTLFLPFALAYKLRRQSLSVQKAGALGRVKEGRRGAIAERLSTLGDHTRLDDCLTRVLGDRLGCEYTSVAQEV